MNRARFSFLMFCLCSSLWSCCAIVVAQENIERTTQPIAIHPENPKYFLFRGKPLVLITGTEHYGAVQNRRVDYVKYLDDTADKQITLSRLFLLFREQQSSRNPYSTLKIESPDFVTPFMRTGPERALDGEPVYDLDQWNPEFFERLHGFLSLASQKGVIVEVVLFSNSYGPPVWALNPLKSDNNKQGVGKIGWADYLRGANEALMARQITFTRKIVRETHRYDNIYYEICNEPGGGVPGHATVDEVNRWQERIAEVIREELDAVGAKHLVAGQEAFDYSPEVVPNLDDGPNWPHVFSYEKSFGWYPLDVVNVHPLPNVIYAGKAYQMGRFMSKELKLQALRDFSLATYKEKKPLVHDEDNIATLYLDDDGWTIHRKRAWTAVLSGAHYNAIDFSIIAGREAGTEESNRKIRTWYKHLSGFIHSFDFVNSEPMPEWLHHAPAPSVASVLAIAGKDYVAYLADSRELTNPAHGQTLRGRVGFALPPGEYQVMLFSPLSGMYSPALVINGGRDVELQLPEFKHDIVIRVTRTAAVGREKSTAER